MLRCAELCLERGYSFFTVVDAADSAKVFTYTTPAHATTTGTVTGIGDTAYVSAQTTVTPGQTNVYVKPRRTNTIVCFKDRSEAQGMILEAAFVSNSIRDKYRMPRRNG